MTRRAVIDGGIVVNIIEAGPDFELPGKTLVDAGNASIGWSWDGEAFTSPPAPPVTADQVDAERDRRIDAGFAFNGVHYQSAPKDRENIAGAATAALGAMMAGVQPGDLRWHGGGDDFRWIAADNTEHDMDAQTTFAFGQEAMRHKQAHIFAARVLKDMDPIPADYATNEAYWP
ncbi:DUF4376 domain-containing protein [Pararhizobium haloflavum]|uniref:DUF4376 domain-containing protein n=1 Tax=Pararhizobium haloflavum TaxID=2037914 RepID=UPI000C18934F|nr:DUF4376 domain-containing protein [Pararhizobium haloflavum]